MMRPTHLKENKAYRGWKHLLHEFPVGHDVLAKGIYEDAGDDEELDLELIPFVYSHHGVPSDSISTTSTMQPALLCQNFT
jgi:hypothetical protein